MNALKIYCDGGARGNPGPAAAAFVVVGSQGKILAKKGVFIGRATNNFAEYAAVRLALAWLVQARIKKDVKFYLDSQLVVNQMTGKFKIREENLKKVAVKIKDLEKRLTGRITWSSVARSGNKLADFLVNQTLDARSAAKRK